MKSLIGEASGVDAIKSLSLSDGAASLKDALAKAQSEMTAALADSFDTPRAMRIIAELISQTNIHINTHKADLDIKGVEANARWVTKVVGIFGLDANAIAPYNGLGWASSAANSNLSPKEIVQPYSEVYQKVKS